MQGGSDIRPLKANEQTARRIMKAVTYTEQQNQRLSPDGDTWGRGRHYRQRVSIKGNSWDATHSRYHYGWETSSLDPETEDWTPFTDSTHPSGTPDKNFLINDADSGAQGSPIPDDTPVIMWAEYDDDGNPQLVFSSGGSGGSVTPGMYLGMVYQVTASNTAGWDWDHTHSEIP